MKIYYLTRSYPPSSIGSTLMRKAQVEQLEKNGWNVQVITPNYGANSVTESENIVRIPLNYNIKIFLVLERLSFIEDYLQKWVHDAFLYLRSRVTKNDLIFATSGGELGMFILAAKLKREIGCKIIMNLRDPINYSLVNGLKRDAKFHVSREKVEKNILEVADIILTSSKSNQISLQSKYPHLRKKIKNNYFGYAKKIDLRKYHKNPSKINVLRIGYAGLFGETQKPEILSEIRLHLKDRQKIEVFYVGNHQRYKPLFKERNNPLCHFIDRIPHDAFLKFMSENIDVGFLPLARDYFGACVPSKLYEYINLGLPILGALPEGDAKDIITKNKFGISLYYKNCQEMADAIDNIIENPQLLKNYQASILAKRKKWSMDERFTEVNSLIDVMITKR